MAITAFAGALLAVDFSMLSDAVPGCTRTTQANSRVVHGLLCATREAAHPGDYLLSLSAAEGAPDDAGEHLRPGRLLHVSI